MDVKTLQKQVVDLTALVRGLQRVVSVLNGEVQKLSSENRHLKARIEGVTHNVNNIIQRSKREN